MPAQAGQVRMIEAAFMNSLFGLTLALCDPCVCNGVARNFSYLCELPTVTPDARFLGRDGVGAIGGGVSVAHGLNMTGSVDDDETSEIQRD